MNISKKENTGGASFTRNTSATCSSYIFVGRIVFSITEAFFFFNLVLFLLLIFSSITPFPYVAFLVTCLILYIIIGIPINILIRFLQAKHCKMPLKDFLHLPCNWVVYRFQLSKEILQILYPGKKFFLPQTYGTTIIEVKRKLAEEKSKVEYYANIANNASSETEFSAAINSCIKTLEWMSQFEKYNVFVQGNAPSDDLRDIKDNMQLSIDRLHRRLASENAQLSTSPASFSALSTFDTMDGHDFEYFCADLLRKNGFSNVEVTQGSGDHGVDIFAEQGDVTFAIQCKRYEGSVPYKAIQEAYSAKGIFNKDVAVVMTNSTFTQQGIEDAKRLSVKLWDRDKLNEFIRDAAE